MIENILDLPLIVKKYFEPVAQLDTCLPAGREYWTVKHVKIGSKLMERILYVYVMISKLNGRKYIGITSDLNNRWNEHNSGKTKSTKAFCP